ncbi:MAG TPA: hypothetical protein VKM94_18790 [Blastocatellia bacterium]|nr:hypothetical protein [Blastocatellia bacterium]
MIQHGSAHAAQHYSALIPELDPPYSLKRRTRKSPRHKRAWTPVLCLLLSAAAPNAFSQNASAPEPRRAQQVTQANRETQPHNEARERSPEPSDSGKHPASTTEVDQLRSEVQALKAQVEQLRKLIEAGALARTGAQPSQPADFAAARLADNSQSQPDAQLQATAQSQQPNQKQQKLQSQPANQYANQDPSANQTGQRQSTIDALIKPKSAGGQFAGSEGLLRTDRLKIGGYVDFRYLSRGFDEGFEIREHADELNPGETDRTNFKRNTFMLPRAIIGMAAAITPKLLFNSEIEFEFGGKEVDVEQAYLEYRFNPKFNLRGGVIVAPLGRFNIFHDSNLQDMAPRPLVSTLVIPSTYKDLGVGALGEFRLGSRSRLTYEAYIVNGLRSDEGGEIAREIGTFESKENSNFFDNNPQKSVVGRVMFSPIIGLELGLSGYRGKHDNQGLYNMSIWAVDWKFARKDFQVIGEYARTAVQRPPEDAAEIAARQILINAPRGDFVGTFEELDEIINEPLFDRPARSSDGIYIEARYRFRPKWWTSHLEEDASIAPVVRFDQVNLDRQFPGFSFPLNMRRLSLGVSLRPTEAASINFAYHFDRKPDLFLRLPDGRPFPPYFTNLGVNGFTMGLAWAF